jgi:hypothetical protein
MSPFNQLKYLTSKRFLAHPYRMRPNWNLFHASVIAPYNVSVFGSNCLTKAQKRIELKYGADLIFFNLVILQSQI